MSIKAIPTLKLVVNDEIVHENSRGWTQFLCWVGNWFKSYREMGPSIAAQTQEYDLQAYPSFFISTNSAIKIKR